MVKKHMEKIPKRSADSNKGDYGHVLVVAGSRGMTGAAYFTGQAALLSGSGLVTTAIPESQYEIMAVKFIEVMTLPVADTKDGAMSAKAEDKILEFSEKSDVVAIGPGMSRNEETAKLIRSLLKNIKKPVVLDADGINALEHHQEALKNRKAMTILTPHPGEMARLIKKDASYVQKARENIAKSFALQYNCVLILKGHRTVVSNSQGDLYINETGNSGMSTAGVGDVLTGVVASLVGQGIDPYSAACAGVYLHGRAGDIAAAERGQFGMIATDVLWNLPRVFRENI